MVFARVSSRAHKYSGTPSLLNSYSIMITLIISIILTFINLLFVFAGVTILFHINDTHNKILRFIDEKLNYINSTISRHLNNEKH